MTRRLPIALALALTSLAALACGGDEKDEEPVAVAPPPPPPAPVLPEPEPEPDEEESEVNQLATKAGQAFADSVRTATEAIDAAATEVADDSPCGQAWTGIQRMVAIARQLNPDGEAATPELPSLETFMRRCQRLPEPVQQCLVMSYVLEHREECERYTTQIRELQRVARGG
ncbi:MAG: hypothetical protein AAGH15_19245 [Myxococcota bacterium]